MRTTPTNNVAAGLMLLQEKFAGVSDTPELDAQVLLAHLFGKPRSWLMAHPEQSLPEDVKASLPGLLQRLEAAEPLPYILGHWEFYGLDFLVSPAVLIPRPETELLVEEALHWAKLHVQNPRVLDIGTGSGCIAISLAKHLPQATVFAGDISRQALTLAQANAAKHQVTDRVHFFQGSLLDPLSAPFDLIAANLPYIPGTDLGTLTVAQHEPRLALDGGCDGLDLIRRLIDQAPRCLASGGELLLEIEVRQGAAVLSLAQVAFPSAKIELHQDLSHLDRFVTVQNL